MKIDLRYPYSNTENNTSMFLIREHDMYPTKYFNRPTDVITQKEHVYTIVLLLCSNDIADHLEKFGGLRSKSAQILLHFMQIV